MIRNGVTIVDTFAGSFAMRAARAGGYQSYTGDACVPGKGEILIWRLH